MALLLELPKDVLYYVESMLNVQDLWILKQTCKTFSIVTEVVLAQVFKNSDLVFDLAQYNNAMKLLSSSPFTTKSVQFLIDSGLIQDSNDETVARFLYKYNHMRFEKVGNFLSMHEHTILSHYAKLFDFKGLFIIDALRLFLESFSLPGEASLIGRLLEAFATQYSVCNPGIFQDEATPYPLAYAIIMINTDRHNDHVKNKMSKDAFVRNLAGLDGGADLPVEYIHRVYDAVVMRPFFLAKTEKVECWLAKSTDNKRWADYYVAIHERYMDIHAEKKREYMYRISLLDYNVEMLPNNTTFKLSPRGTTTTNPTSANKAAPSWWNSLFSKDTWEGKELYFAARNAIDAISCVTTIEKLVSKHYAGILSKRILDKNMKNVE